MNTQQVANRLVHLCREGKHMDALEELYGPNIISKEMHWMPEEVETKGIEAVRKKSVDWLNNVQEFHSGEVSDPIIAGNHFTIKMDFDITFKDRGRTQMEEICVYEVNDGKIVDEQFFYSE
ncbi:hypothetical protein A9Q87_13275 [Flavobacteriales bacterium 34_180_T64]|nr:hypothetical protein A9Q87_13275 [Flavobacteriales bacterium 34_180_T64]